jgi:dihydrodipicolinate synthase/N-acetylneuraminate lyase
VARSDGSWKPGQCGNPKGRPKGARDRRSNLRYGLLKEVPDILKTLAAAAKGGDIQAAKLILERTLPALKSAAEPLTLPAPETLAGQGRVVMEAVASGEITPDEALKLMQAVGAQLRIVEAEEMAKRIEALEQALSRRQR